MTNQMILGASPLKLPAAGGVGPKEGVQAPVFPVGFLGSQSTTLLRHAILGSASMTKGTSP